MNPIIRKQVQTKGYNPDTSFNGCICCYEPDGLTYSYHQRNIEIFKVLLSATSDEYLEEVCGNITYSVSCIPYLRLIRDRISIGPGITTFLVESDGFNVVTVEKILDFISEKTKLNSKGYP